MSLDTRPDPETVFPISGLQTLTYVKPAVRNPNISVGDFTYFSGDDFERHVTHHYDFYGDRLVIGKFCQIAAGVTFVMNGANHQMNAVSTYPFYIFEGWGQEAPPMRELSNKGDTVVGNDVWIGENATILPGVRVGDGAIIGTRSVVGSDVPPYSIVVGDPARVMRKRFDDELIGLLLRLRWWDRDIDEIRRMIPTLCCSDLSRVRETIRKWIGGEPV